MREREQRERTLSAGLGVCHVAFTRSHVTLALGRCTMQRLSASVNAHSPRISAKSGGEDWMARRSSDHFSLPLHRSTAITLPAPVAYYHPGVHPLFSQSLPAEVEATRWHGSRSPPLAAGLITAGRCRQMGRRLIIYPVDARHPRNPAKSEFPARRAPPPRRGGLARHRCRVALVATVVAAAACIAPFTPLLRPLLLPSRHIVEEAAAGACCETAAIECATRDDTSLRAARSCAQTHSR